MQVAVDDMLTAGKEEAYLLPTMGMMSRSADALEVAKAVICKAISALDGCVPTLNITGHCSRMEKKTGND